MVVHAPACLTHRSYLAVGSAFQLRGAVTDRTLTEDPAVPVVDAADTRLARLHHLLHALGAQFMVRPSH